VTPLNQEDVFAPTVLREYALLADGERGVLVGPRGDYAWMCLPRWDSDAVWSALLNGPGGYSVTPTDGRFVWGGHYEQRTLIWRSRWVTTTGIIECREALAFPGDPHTAVVLRRIVAVDGDAEVRVRLAVRGGFGSHRLRVEDRRGDGFSAASGPIRVRWHAGCKFAFDADGTAEAVIAVTAGSAHDLVLELSDRQLPRSSVDADESWRTTENAWHQAVPAFEGTLADRDVRHAYAVLRGLTAAGGGMAAAATMSLPERAEQGRNYDYRYAWVRDQCYAGQAVAVAGPGELLDTAVGFVAERLRADGPQMKPAYTVSGGRVPDEQQLSLPGYPGATVKSGNWVNGQFQLDAFGEALLLFAAAARVDSLDAAHWPAVEAAVAAIEARWRDADAGIWELDNARWAHSRLTCAAGLRAMGTFAPSAQAAKWSAFADAIVADAAADCLHPTGRWQRAANDPRVDAALLLPSVRGALASSDPRTRATLDAVRADLSSQGYLYRFRHTGETLPQAEGAFLLCGFIMALAEHQQGNHVAAARWFERNRAACGPPGLYTEEYDVEQRQLRGNLPQAFVHAVFFEAAHRLTDTGDAVQPPYPRAPRPAVLDNSSEADRL
jgi:GH15 family glucan-1,4-alpha-glucosidase